MLPVRLVLARIPVEPLAPVIWIVPSFFTLLLLSIVTAAPPVGFTDPAEVIRISSPKLLVVTGVVIAVLMTCSATAGVTKTAARALDAKRKRMDKIIPFVPATRGRRRLVTHARIP